MLIYREHNRGGSLARTYGVKVTNLPLDVTKGQLRLYFDQYGDIESVVVLSGHAFVNFYSISCAKESAERMNGTLLGGQVIICKVNSQPRYVEHKLHTVKVSNLSKSTTELTLFHVFSLEDGGDPESVRIIQCSKKPHNYAFVNFFSHRDAQRAARSRDGMYLDGSEITASLQTDKPTQPQAKSTQVDVSKQSVSVKATQSGPHPNRRRSHVDSTPTSRQQVNTPVPSGWRSTTVPSGWHSTTVPSGWHSTTVPSDISSSSLLVSILRVKHKGYLEKLEKENQVQISLKPTSISVKALGKREGATLAEKLVKSLKKDVESGIISKEFSLLCHCVPLFEKGLAMLKKIEVDHGVEVYVLKGSPWSSMVDLVSFSEDVKRCFTHQANAGDEDNIPTRSDLMPYFFSSGAAASGGDCGRVRWYYKDDFNIFIEYTASQSTVLEQMFQTKLSRPMIINGNRYSFDFSAMTQSNALTGRSRGIKREAPNLRHVLQVRVTGLPDSLDPSIQALQEAVKTATVEKECRLYDDCSDAFKRTLIAKMNKYFVIVRLIDDGRLKIKGVAGYVERVHLLAEQEKISDRERQIHTAVGGGEEFKPPAHWRQQPEEVMLDVVRRNSKEWNDEVESFCKTLRGATVVRLERIQNKWLWERYCFAKKRMLRTNMGHVNEKHLFHGTRSTQPEKIFKSEKGVDFRFSGEGLWGTGSYFAVNASYSDAYAYSTPGGINEKQMFICKVLTGDSYNAGTNTDRTLRQPPVKSGHGEEEKRYDSVKGYTNGSYVYVVYDHEKVYPAYLVTYTLDHLAAYMPSPFSYQQPRAPQVPAASKSQNKKDSCIIS